jgi:hypothetical protein
MFQKMTGQIKTTVHRLVYLLRYTRLQQSIAYGHCGIKQEGFEGIK